MGNWFKKAWNHGVPLMDEYSDGNRPPSSRHKKDPRSLVNAKPEFGGNERPGYPKGISQNPENSDDPQWAKLHGTIPGEAVLMDDGGDSHDGLGDRFVGQDEFNTDDDKLPIGKDQDSVQLDSGAVGPHNMQNANLFSRVKRKTRIKGLKL